MTPLALGLVLLVLVIGLAGAVMVPAYLRQRIDWKTTPRGYLYFAHTPEHRLSPTDARGAAVELHA